MSVIGSYFDGISARRHPVSLEVKGGKLCMHGEGVERLADRGQITVPSRLGNTTRLILFADGARCEITDHDEFEALLTEMGINPSLVAHIESRWRYALTALAITLTLVAVAYFWGLPYAAEKIAFQVPDKVLALIDEQFIKAVDNRLLEPSKLSKERQFVITSRLNKLHVPAIAAKPTKMLFRRSPTIGPNAFALPGGTIVVLDEIVALSSDDDEIIAVLAHEMGHVAERHALRQMLQASVVGLAMAWYVGDISTVLAAAPTALLETRYSRDFERRADTFGAGLLALNHIPASRLADILEKLERAHGGKESKAVEKDVMDYLSSHPNTTERIRALRGER